jgi:hypothetical protein
MEEVNFWFEDLAQIQEWQKHFRTSIEPLEIDEEH